MAATFIAIDSGGTRTNSRVFVAEGEELERQFSCREALSGYLPPRDYAQTLSEILKNIEAYWVEYDLIGSPTYVFISAAGFSTSTRGLFSSVMEAVLAPALSQSIVTAGGANDAVTLLLGHGADGAVIAGTGSNVLVKNRADDLFQAGGHDWVACDYGSGFWLGLNGIRQAARDFEAGEPSVLLSRVEEQYGIDPDDESALIARFRSLAVGDSRMKAEIARFSASVCDAAELGDVAAQDVVKREAEDLADSFASAVRRRFSRDEIASGLNIVQCGGVLANDFYRQSFETHVQMRLSGIENGAIVHWQRVKNGLDATMILAKSLQQDPQGMLSVSSAHRPAVLRFR